MYYSYESSMNENLWCVHTFKIYFIYSLESGKGEKYKGLLRNVCLLLAEFLVKEYQHVYRTEKYPKTWISVCIYSQKPFRFQTYEKLEKKTLYFLPIFKC